MKTEELQAKARQLRSKDPKVRRAAIVWLAKTKDTSALRPLRWAYQNDPDEELRQLALKGGRHIKQHVSVSKTQTMETPQVKRTETATKPLQSLIETKTLPRTPQKRRPETETKPLQSRIETAPLKEQELDARTTALLEAVRKTRTARAIDPEPDYRRKTVLAPVIREPEEESDGVTKIEDVVEGYERYSYQVDPNAEGYISRRDWEYARTLASEAYTAYTQSKPVSGLRKLSEAFRLDPGIHEEIVAQRAMGALIPELSVQKATEILLDPDRCEALVRERHKKQVGLTYDRNALDVVIGTLLLSIIQVAGLWAVLTAIRANPQARLTFMDLGTPVSVNDLMNSAVSAVSNSELIPVAAVAGLSLVGLFFVHTFVVHGVTRFVLRGNGTFIDTHTNLNRLMMWVSAVFFAVLAVIATGIEPVVVDALLQRIVWGIGAAVLLAVGFRQARLMALAHQIRTQYAAIAVAIGLAVFTGLAWFVL